MKFTKVPLSAFILFVLIIIVQIKLTAQVPKSKKSSKSKTVKVNIPAEKKSPIKGVEYQEFLYEEADFSQSNSATIVENANGDLISAFYGVKFGESTEISIYTCRKNKNSQTWTAPVLVADGLLNSSLKEACYNPVLYQMTAGPLFLFYKIGNSPLEWKGYMKQSDDGGYTWGKAYQLPTDYLGPTKNKIIESDGRAIAPSSTQNVGWQVYLEIAEFIGKRTHIVGPLEAEKALMTVDMELTESNETNPEAEERYYKKLKTIQAAEPCILTHGKGKLQILCRTRNGKIATSWSSDNGENWTPLSLTTLPSNNSGIDAVTLNDGRHVLIFNAVETPAGKDKGSESPLNIAVSDDGIRWKTVMTLENTTDAQFSSPSIFQGKDGRIHVVYTWNNQKIKYLQIKL